MVTFILAFSFSNWLVFANMQIERSIIFHLENTYYEDAEDKHLWNHTMFQGLVKQRIFCLGVEIIQWELEWQVRKEFAGVGHL